VVDHISEAQEQKWRLWSEGREPALQPAAAIASD
jgi:hypothetical protein